MTLANKLTLSRIILVAPFVILLSIGGELNSFIALLIYSVAAVTDFFDGKIARKRGEVSDFGKYMDPLADKIFVSAALIIFVGMRELNIPAWPVIIIISRELIIGVLRSLAASKGRVIAADKTGKFKTAFQMIVVFISLIIVSFDLKDLVPYIYYLLLMTALITLYSGVNYVKVNFDVFRD